MNIRNPKQKTTGGDNIAWYSYYAGFSSDFVNSIIDGLQMPCTSIILDPWNGSGTTTLAASLRGISSIGIDLNPAMCVVAKSRIATHFDINTAEKKVKYARVTSFKNTLTNDDYLLNWFEYPVASYIRYLANYIYGRQSKLISDKINELSVHQCISYLALFKTVRGLLHSFKSSNPTWIKKKNDLGRVDVLNASLKSIFIHNIKEFYNHCNVRKNEIEPILLHGNSKKMMIDDNSIDYVITSPPYCTRLDYGIATSPELAVLLGDTIEIDMIRRALTGRTTIDRNLDTSEIFFPKVILDFLKSVKAHSSRASDTYYYKNLLQYFNDIKISLNEISRVVKKTGFFICVVQDSFYKDIYCDLPKMMISLAEYYGFSLNSQIHFESRTNMANINTISKNYRKNTHATESVLVFTKDK
ncbi:DNA methyltransferase [Buttiauxella gaviniae]|uniref:Methyltransferase n=1 Tax=Buttiauxella gaviniae TaxID=82990 RepID=A0ABV3NVL9_9ENTR